MAYDVSKFEAPDSTDTWLKAWATRDFGPQIAARTAAVMATYGKLIVRRRYEQLNLSPFMLSTANYDEAEKVLGEWTDMLAEAQALYDSLDAATRTAFFQFVLHPVLAGKTVQEIYIQAARNAYYASMHRMTANNLATAVANAFTADASITSRYHTMNGGKWNHFMDQVHLGYSSWFVWPFILFKTSTVIADSAPTGKTLLRTQGRRRQRSRALMPPGSWASPSRAAA
jgi:hypothetical protein